MPPIATIVPRLSPPVVRSRSIPYFVAGPSVTTKRWADWAATHTGQTLNDYLDTRITHHADRADSGSGKGTKRHPKVIIFGEQHHQPKVLAAQLKLVHELATAPHNFKVTVVMEHFNLLQQSLLDDFARTGDAEILAQEYAKSREGFRINDTGYLPLLRLIRELENVNSAVKAGFPPREWARTIMRQGKEVLLRDDAQVTLPLGTFDRWEDINVSPEHAAYIASSINGTTPVVQDEVSQGGLKAAQAFKDAIMAWRIDEEVERATKFSSHGDPSGPEIVVAICGSGHCEYDFGVTERIRSCRREDIMLLVCKPDDGTFWESQALDNESHTGRALADGIMIYEAIDI